jgi:hypothetical protein
MIGAGGVIDGDGDVIFDACDLFLSTPRICFGSREVSDRSGVGYAELKEVRRFNCERRGVGASVFDGVFRRLWRRDSIYTLVYACQASYSKGWDNYEDVKDRFH